MTEQEAQYLSSDAVQQNLYYEQMQRNALQQ